MNATLIAMIPSEIAFFGKSIRGIASLELLIAKNIKISFVAVSPDDTDEEDYRVRRPVTLSRRW